MFEKLIGQRIVDHMNRNNVFSNKQFVFIWVHSTCLQLLTVLDIWTEILDNGGTIHTIDMDFMKAFDKVPHKRLIRSYKHMELARKCIP